MISSHLLPIVVRVFFLAPSSIRSYVRLFVHSFLCVYDFHAVEITRSCSKLWACACNRTHSIHIDSWFLSFLPHSLYVSIYLFLLLTVSHTCVHTILLAAILFYICMRKPKTNEHFIVTILSNNILRRSSCEIDSAHVFFSFSIFYMDV